MRLGVTAVADIECEDWDTFVLGGLLDEKRGYRESRDSSEYLAWILELEGDVWAHWGGRYDWVWLCNELKRISGERARLNLAGPVITRVDVGRLRLRDSGRLMPFSLKRVAGLAGVGYAKEETGLSCRCGASCGGYCSIRRAMAPAEWAALSRYLRADCEILWQALHNLLDFAAEHGITLKGTCGGTGWATATRWLDLMPAAWDPQLYRLCAEAKAGGRCEVYRTRETRGEEYDVRSMYPWALAEAELPTGDPAVVTGRAACRAWERGRPGVYAATAAVPEQWVPPLPIRSGDRLCFPHGRVTGTWGRDELRHAVERAGAVVERVNWALVWPGEARIMAPLVERLGQLRMRVGPDTPWGQWLKWILNPLTGKFGQDPETSLYCVGEAPRLCDGGGRACPWPEGEHPAECCPHRCRRRCGRWDALDPGGRLWYRKTWRLADCAHLHWNVALTGRARVELWEQLVEAGGALCYTDTDSVHSIRPLTRRVGSSVGDWEHKGSWRYWQALAPKAYRFWRDGAWVTRLKGLARADLEDFDWYAAGEPVMDDRGVMGIRSAARGLPGAPGRDRAEWFRRKRVARAALPHGRWCGARLRDGDLTLAPEAGRDLAELAGGGSPVLGCDP